MYSNQFEHVKIKLLFQCSYSINKQVILVLSWLMVVTVEPYKERIWLTAHIQLAIFPVCHVNTSSWSASLHIALWWMHTVQFILYSYCWRQSKWKLEQWQPSLRRKPRQCKWLWWVRVWSHYTTISEDNSRVKMYWSSLYHISVIRHCPCLVAALE